MAEVPKARQAAHPSGVSVFVRQAVVISIVMNATAQFENFKLKSLPTTHPILLSI